MWSFLNKNLDLSLACLRPFSVTAKPNDWAQTLQTAPGSLCLSAASSVALHLLFPLTPSPGEPLAFPHIAVLSLCLHVFVLASILVWQSSLSHPASYPLHLLFPSCILDLVSRSQTLGSHPNSPLTPLPADFSAVLSCYWIICTLLYLPCLRIYFPSRLLNYLKVGCTPHPSFLLIMGNSDWRGSWPHPQGCSGCWGLGCFWHLSLTHSSHMSAFIVIHMSPFTALLLE